MRTRMYGVVRGGRRNPTPYSIALVKCIKMFLSEGFYLDWLHSAEFGSCRGYYL